MHQDNKSKIQSSSAVEPTWTREENKRFEVALVVFREEEGDERWRRIAASVPGKTVEQVRLHYQKLLDNLDAIGKGELDELLIYQRVAGKKPSDSNSSESRTSGVKKGSEDGQSEKKKGIPWTPQEHRKFLEGLSKFGKGKWRDIAYYSVGTRSPIQVASHAQKYFLRQTYADEDKLRPSIHDVTITDTPTVVQPPPPLPSPPRHRRL